MKESAESRIVTWVVSSQQRLFSDALPCESLTRLSALQNEPISFCVGYRSLYKIEENERIPDLPISISAFCDGVEVSAYKVDFVPFSATACEDGEGLHGLCPDILHKRINAPEIVAGDSHLPFYEKGQKNLLNASCISTGSVWFTLNEQRALLPPGDHPVTVCVTSLTTGEVIGEHALELHVVNGQLPDTGLFYTNWFHYDCIADLHGLELYSDAYFEVLAKYIKNAVKNGMTTLLTPAFTPALDTPVGFERRNVQLVGVKRENGRYSFDFSLLERFVKLALDCGITNIEHCHLFSSGER